MIKLKDIKESDFQIASKTFRFYYKGYFFEIICLTSDNAFQYIIEGAYRNSMYFMSTNRDDFEYALFRYIEFHKIDL